MPSDAFMKNSSVSRSTIEISEHARRASGQAIGFLMQQAVENAGCLSLAAGLVDESTLPVELIREISAELSKDPGIAQKALQYGTTGGSEELRAEVRRHLARLDRDDSIQDRLSLDQIVVTTGSQQFLNLLTQAVFNPGDICLVAAPTYFVYLGVLDAAGVRAVPVKCDWDGMCPEDLERVLGRLRDQELLHRIRMIYVVSYFDNPSGVNLAAERRRMILDAAVRWSDQHRILILEDAAYRELDYAGTALPSLWSLDTAQEHVILTQTFSKSFAPGIRVGFGVLPGELVKAVCDLKGNDDFGSAHWNQKLMAALLRSGRYREHVRTVCSGYRRKRDAMLHAADRYFSRIEGVDWVRPGGGLYIWMSLPAQIFTGFDSELFAVATKQEGVMYVPGELAYPTDWSERPRHQMRLSFGVLNESDIDEAMRRLSRAVTTVLR